MVIDVAILLYGMNTFNYDSGGRVSDYNFIDLFCGAGGLSTGLEMAGFKCIYANDVDAYSIDTIRANYPETLATCEPIQLLTKDKIRDYVGDKKIHLVAGGPPCQGFSTVGKGDPNDPKNVLFEHFVRVVDTVRPNLVLFENVTGILAAKNRPTLDNIVESFNQIGYKLFARVLESQHYGVPQKRKRTILVGTRNGEDFSFPVPGYDINFGKLYVPPKTLGGALLELEGYIANIDCNDELHDIGYASISKEIDLKRIRCVPEGAYIRYKRDEDKYLPKKLKLGVDWETVREGRLRENHYHRLSRKKVSPTIMTKNNNYYHPTENRRFTLRELATLQSFPPNYIFKGSKVSIARQIGNAVPPLMARAIGKEILRMLKGNSTVEAGKDNSIEKIRSTAFNY